MSSDLFLSILAMDSYNRGYGQGVNELPVALNSTKIGDATIIRQSDILSNTPGVNAGFYAIAYNVTNVSGFSANDTVIAFRGTNFNFNSTVSDFLDSPAVLDAINGWSVGAGQTGGQDRGRTPLLGAGPRHRRTRRAAVRSHSKGSLKCRRRVISNDRIFNLRGVEK